MTKKIEINPKVAKFKIGERVRITKYKNIFSKGYTKKWSREIFVIDSDKYLDVGNERCTCKLEEIK